MDVELYILIAVTVTLTSFNYRVRIVLNDISEDIALDKGERNKYQIVMQPKWLLHATWILTLLWLYLAYLLFQIKSWWAIVYVLAFYFFVAVLSKILRFPTFKHIIALLHSTTIRRLSNTKLTFIERGYLTVALQALEKAEASRAK